MSDDEKETTLVDIYVAAGAQLSADGTMVSFDRAQLNSFEIILRVFPKEVRVERPWQGAEPETYVTFDVLLGSSIRIGEPGFLGHPVEEIIHEAGFELPVDQVRIYNKE